MGIDYIKKNRIDRFIVGTAVVAGIFLLFLGIYQLIYPQVEVTWSTATEVDTFGYNLLRSDLKEGPFDLQVNDQIIEATGQPVSGSNYSYFDRNVKTGATYYYLLEEVQLDGAEDHFGPITVKAESYGWIEICLSLVIFFTIIFYLRSSK